MGRCISNVPRLVGIVLKNERGLRIWGLDGWAGCGLWLGDDEGQYGFVMGRDRAGSGAEDQFRRLRYEGGIAGEETTDLIIS